MARARWALMAMLLALTSACGEAAGRAFNERLERAEISVEAFRAGSIETDGPRIIVRRTGPNAMGVLLRLGQDASDRRFAAAFATTSDGRVSLRTQSGGNLQYSSGSDGFIRLGGGVEEVILYSDDAETIEVTVESVLDCARTKEGPCYAVEDLRREIFPNGEPADRREHLLALLNWASNNADYAATTTMNERGKSFVRRYDAPLMYSTIYRNDIAGGYCGTNAIFFASLLRAFGYDAMTINYGLLEPELTHVTTVVYNPFGEGQFYILDPTFNAHLVDRQTRAWAPFDHVLARSPHSFDIVVRPMTERHFLFPINDRTGLAALDGQRPEYQNCRRADQSIVCERPDFGISSYLLSFNDALSAASLPATPEGFLRLFRSRYFSVGGGGSDTARAELRGLLMSNGLIIAPRAENE